MEDVDTERVINNIHSLSDGLRLIVGIAGGQIIEKDLGQGMEKNIIKLSSDAIGTLISLFDDTVI